MLWRVVRLDRHTYEAPALPLYDRNLHRVVIPKPALKLLGRQGFRVWQWYSAHLHPPIRRAWADLRQIGERGKALASLIGERMAGGAYLRPLVLSLKRDGIGYAQIGRRVIRTYPSKVILEGRRTWFTSLPPPAHDERLQQRLALRSSIQKARANRRGEPFMRVAHVKIRPQVIEVQVNLSGRMRTINDGENALLRRATAYLLNWEDESRWRRNVAHNEHTSALRHSLPEILDDRLLARDRKRDLLRAVLCAALLADEPPRALDGAVFVIGAKHLIARLQVE